MQCFYSTLKSSVSCPVLFWAHTTEVLRCRDGWNRSRWHHECDTWLRVAVTTVPAHQSHLSDRCMCVCGVLCRVPVHTEDGYEGQDGWGRMTKNNHLKFTTYLLWCVVLFSLFCSESTGHDYNHRRLGLANISITWGKNDLTKTSDTGMFAEQLPLC